MAGVGLAWHDPMQGRYLPSMKWPLAGRKLGSGGWFGLVFTAKTPNKLDQVSRRDRPTKVVGLKSGCGQPQASLTKETKAGVL
jgi:hypothetical protein